MTTTRERLGLATGALIAILVFLLVAAYSPRAFDEPGNAARAGISVVDQDTRLDAEGNEELEEQAESIERRSEAWEAAVRAGSAGQAALTRHMTGLGSAVASGWAGERPIETMADDWEPAIAADPKAPYVYLLTTRYGTEKPCPGQCPIPWISLTVSHDNGATWGETKPLCACRGKGQFDPIIEVVPATGAVYALYMNSFNVMFTKSTDHGATWSSPVKTYGRVAWNDKPVIAMSDDGRYVYTSFNGPSNGDPWVARSADFGATWTQTKLVKSERYYFAFDADVASDGTVYFAQSSLLYTDKTDVTPFGAVDEHVFISRDNGETWVDKVVAQTELGVTCVAEGCTEDFYVGHTALSADGHGRLVFLYDGATTPGGLQSIWMSRSSDRGATWTRPERISKSREEAVNPMIESRGNGDVRIGYAQTSAGGNVDAWNTWYRDSTNGGAAWSAPVRISDATSGAPYKTAAGYAEVYGDYGEMAITSAGKTIATWGEGLSYTGPGGVWVNRER